MNPPSSQFSLLILIWKQEPEQPRWARAALAGVSAALVWRPDRIGTNTAPALALVSFHCASLLERGPFSSLSLLEARWLRSSTGCHGGVDGRVPGSRSEADTPDSLPRCAQPDGTVEQGGRGERRCWPPEVSVQGRAFLVEEGVEQKCLEHGCWCLCFEKGKEGVSRGGLGEVGLPPEGPGSVTPVLSAVPTPPRLCQGASLPGTGDGSTDVVMCWPRKQRSQRAPGVQAQPSWQQVCGRDGAEEGCSRLGSLRKKRGSKSVQEHCVFREARWVPYYTKTSSRRLKWRERKNRLQTRGRQYSLSIKLWILTDSLPVVQCLYSHSPSGLPGPSPFLHGMRNSSASFASLEPALLPAASGRPG